MTTAIAQMRTVLAQVDAAGDEASLEDLQAWRHELSECQAEQILTSRELSRIQHDIDALLAT
jgi:hypothetical protein